MPLLTASSFVPKPDTPLVHDEKQAVQHLHLLESSSCSAGLLLSPHLLHQPHLLLLHPSLPTPIFTGVCMLPARLL